MSRQFILAMLNAISRRILSFWTSIMEMSRSITCRRPTTASSSSSSESAGSSTLTPEPVRRKKALVIGINYPEDGPAVPLKKSHADCQKVKKLLLELHYTEERITMMMGAADVSEELQPTYENIRTQLSLLIKDALPGDHFCLFFTGHGSHEDEVEGHPPEQEVLDGYTQRAETVPSREGDSSKGYLVPCDSKWTKGLEDVIHVKDIRELLIDKMPDDTTLISVIDCCNGGALMGLPYKWRGMGCLEPCLFDQCHVSSGHKPQTITGHQPGRALCISACGDRETTYEHVDYGGLLVEAMLEGYYNKKDITFHELFIEIDERYGKFRKEYQERTKKAGEDFPTFEISSSQPWLFPDSVRRDSKRFLWMDVKVSCQGLGEVESA